MQQFIGYSKTSDINEAISGLSSPKGIIIICDKSNAESASAQLKNIFPSVPTIGCIGQCYAKENILLTGILIVAFYGNVEIKANIITDVNTMPLKHISNVNNDITEIKATKDNTVCIDFTTGNDAVLVTTLNTALKKYDISLSGGTAWESTVIYNGKLYNEACVYMLIKNLDGRIKIYKENLYKPMKNFKRFVATKVKPESCIICELNNMPAQKVYMDELGISPEAIDKQTFINPLGRLIGDEIYIISLKERIGNDELSCYKRVNLMDILTILEIGDYQKIINGTITQIKKDFKNISGMFSINCIFRYLFFEQRGFTGEYFKMMNDLAQHAGLIGLGEHFNTQHINQTMSLTVFE